jgi:glycosyltransferase involved in cell wall biosynthesis
MDKGTANLRRLVVAVDLQPLRPGGENGGIKPTIFALLRAVREEANDRLVFVFLTNSASHAEVRDLAGPNDLLICVLEEAQHPFDELKAGPNEYKIAPVPADLIKALEADLLYCPFGATTFHVPGVPTVALIADLLHKDYPFTLTEEQIAEREAYIQKTVRDATLLQSISRSGMGRLMEHYRVPRERLFYTYLPIHARLDNARPEAAAPVKSITARPFFFYPANLWLHKNHEVLLLSYARYRHLAGEEAWDLVLTFHEDTRADYLRSLAGTLGVLEHVHFLGFLSEPDLRGVWLRAGALVFPSLHEGFGIPLLEAMHHGVPVITSDQFSLKEVAGDACYVIDPRKPHSLSEALRDVAQDGRLREKLIKRGRKRLQLFDVRISAKLLFDSFCSVTRKEDDFPRRPRYASEAPILTAPTPASNERWKIEIHYRGDHSRRKCSIYLNELPFASFSPRSRTEGNFSFVCRPEGRTLALRLAKGNNGKRESISDDGFSVKQILASEDHGGRILLYEEPHPPTLS